MLKNRSNRHISLLCHLIKRNGIIFVQLYDFIASELFLFIYRPECIQSYGENCEYPCNVYCSNQTCDRYNGSCQTDCKDGESCIHGKICIILLW